MIEAYCSAMRNLTHRKSSMSHKSSMWGILRLNAALAGLRDPTGHHLCFYGTNIFINVTLTCLFCFVN